MKEILVRELEQGYLVISRRSHSEPYIEQGREFACETIAKAAEIVSRLLSGELDGSKNEIAPEK